MKNKLLMNIACLSLVSVILLGCQSEEEKREDRMKQYRREMQKTNIAGEMAICRMYFKQANPNSKSSMHRYKDPDYKKCERKAEEKQSKARKALRKKYADLFDD